MNMRAHGNFLSEMWSHRILLGRMARQDINSRYQGSVFGLLWSIATPVMLLCAYWLVLGRIFQARWGNLPGEAYPIVLFGGLVVHLFFAEVLGRAPGLIIDHKTYVKKVVFPLEILSPMTVLTALFHLATGVVILFLGQLLLTGHAPATWIWLPIVLLTLLPMAIGMSWILSSLGVYLRDVQQVVPLSLTLLMFLSPIFYPIDAVPERLRGWLYLNPLTVAIEQVRRVVISGQPPEWVKLGAYLAVSTGVMLIGAWWFRRTKKGFADVL